MATEYFKEFISLIFSDVGILFYFLQKYLFKDAVYLNVLKFRSLLLQNVDVSSALL